MHRRGKPAINMNFTEAGIIRVFKNRTKTISSLFVH